MLIGILWQSDGNNSGDKIKQEIWDWVSLEYRKSIVKETQDETDPGGDDLSKNNLSEDNLSRDNLHENVDDLGRDNLSGDKLGGDNLGKDNLGGDTLDGDNLSREDVDQTNLYLRLQKDWFDGKKSFGRASVSRKSANRESLDKNLEVKSTYY